MKRLLLLVMFFLAVGCVEKTIPQSDAPRMAKEDLKARLGSPDLVLLDVRAGNDWTGSNQKITGARREDPQEVEKWGKDLPKNKTLILYCA